jgi:hypothetical protein
VERGDSVALYGVVDGEFEVTASSDAGIEGRFSLTAALGMVCSKEMEIVWDGDGTPMLPCTFHAGSELSTMEVDGAFNVLPGLPCVSMSDADAVAEARQKLRPVTCFSVGS